MNKKHFILPIIVLALYLLTIWGMVYSETRLLSRFYERHALLLQEIMATKDDKEARIQAVDRFTQDMKISTAQKSLGESSGASQQVVDTLTFGKKHCSMAYQEPCKVYTAQVLEKAKTWSAVNEAWSGKPPQNAIVFGTTYSPLDYITKGITLLIEALLFSWLIGLAYNKRREIRKFYRFNKFRAVTAAVLFVLIIGPILINDDMYFAAPWIWYILAPPLILEDIMGDAGLWLFWPLIILWFYTIATIIDKVRKSR